MNNNFQKSVLYSVDKHAGLLLSLPALAILFLFVIYPFLGSVMDSFTNQSLKTLLNPETREFIGLDNYRGLFASGDFTGALLNTLYFVAVVVPVQTVLALLLAVIVNGTGFWRRILRTGFFLPVITSMAVLSVVWSLLYNPSFGFINAVLEFLGLGAQPFLDSPGQAMPCLMAMSIWQGTGFQMMLFLGGMQVIPRQLYEAARIEDASAWQQFRYVTLPLIVNTTVFVIIITTIFAFKLFVQPHLITHGGPMGSTQTLILMLYDEAFTSGRYGKASAIGVLFFLIVLTVTFAQRKFLPREQKL